MTKFPKDIVARFDHLIELSMQNVRRATKVISANNYSKVEPELKSVLIDNERSSVKADIHLIEQL
jgi:hypothetical protein